MSIVMSMSVMDTVDSDSIADSESKEAAVTAAPSQASRRPQAPEPLNLSQRGWRTLPDFPGLFESATVQTPITPFTKLSEQFRKVSGVAGGPPSSPTPGNDKDAANDSSSLLAVPAFALQPPTPLVPESGANAESLSIPIPSRGNSPTAELEIDPVLAALGVDGDGRVSVGEGPTLLGGPTYGEPKEVHSGQYSSDMMRGLTPGRRSYSTPSPNPSPYRQSHRTWDSQGSISPAQLCSRSVSPFASDIDELEVTSDVGVGVGVGVDGDVDMGSNLGSNSVMGTVEGASNRLQRLMTMPSGDAQAHHDGYSRSPSPYPSSDHVPSQFNTPPQQHSSPSTFATPPSHLAPLPYGFVSPGGGGGLIAPPGFNPLFSYPASPETHHGDLDQPHLSSLQPAPTLFPSGLGLGLPSVGPMTPSRTRSASVSSVYLPGSPANGYPMDEGGMSGGYSQHLGAGSYYNSRAATPMSEIAHTVDNTVTPGTFQQWGGPLDAETIRSLTSSPIPASNNLMPMPPHGGMYSGHGQWGSGGLGLSTSGGMGGYMSDSGMSGVSHYSGGHMRSISEDHQSLGPIRGGGMYPPAMRRPSPMARKGSRPKKKSGPESPAAAAIFGAFQYPAYDGAIVQDAPICEDDIPVRQEYLNKRGFWVGGCLWTWDATLKVHSHCLRICAQCHTDKPGAKTWRRSHVQDDTTLCNKCGIYEHTHGTPRPPRAGDAERRFQPSKRAETYKFMVGGSRNNRRPRRGRSGSPPSLALDPQPVFGGLSPKLSKVKMKDEDDDEYFP